MRLVPVIQTGTHCWHHCKRPHKSNSMAISSALPNQLLPALTHTCARACDAITFSLAFVLLAES